MTGRCGGAPRFRRQEKRATARPIRIAGTPASVGCGGGAGRANVTSNIPILPDLGRPHDSDQAARIARAGVGYIYAVEDNARNALDRVSKTEEGMLQVAVAEDWKKDREGREEVKQVVKPFDWSYSTDYRGTMEGKGNWTETTQQKDPIRTDLLSRSDPILFFDAVDLYEDELADNGIALLSVKIRVMPDRLLMLSRFFLRLDGVVVRMRDTRVYVEHDGKKVIRQYTAKEAAYEEVKEKLRARGEHVTEALRDANKVAPLLGIVTDVTEVIEMG
ncbi:Tap42 interacting protein [Friedmanniomyces endolithicus]|uniref:Tap42 interacting protein n=1 Tax=Friedmanniomyces endolithicus TaxID=329885 RepID=A0AAN6QLY0_9PEZI|nr:Tap42 interacting protein [Friedmanniomyces endolithicus]